MLSEEQIRFESWARSVIEDNYELGAAILSNPATMRKYLKIFHADLVEQIAELERELAHYRNLFTTADKHVVKPGDSVWVRGTGGWKQTTVCEAVTNYMYFDNVKVGDSCFKKPD